MITPEQLNSLYPYERSVLSLIAQGKKNPEIVEILGISLKSVRTYVWKIRIKLGALTRIDMLSEEIKEHLREEMHARARGITAGELEVLRLLAKGMMDKEIARVLGITKSAVSQRISNVRAKFGIEGRVSLVLYAVKEGIVDISEDKEENNNGQ